MGTGTGTAENVCGEGTAAGVELVTAVEFVATVELVTVVGLVAATGFVGLVTEDVIPGGVAAACAVDAAVLGEELTEGDAVVPSREVTVTSVGVTVEAVADAVGVAVREAPVHVEATPVVVAVTFGVDVDVALDWADRASSVASRSAT